jgi:hypothetical protein
MNGKRLLMYAIALAVLIGAFVVTGCEVRLSPAYSSLLDRTAELSRRTAEQARAGELTREQMLDALDLQARIWQRFRDARDGVADPVPLRQPTAGPRPGEAGKGYGYE